MSAENESHDALSRSGVSLDASAETRSFFEAVLGSLGEAVFVVDPPERRILLTNRAAGELFGVNPDELIGAGTRLLYPSREEYELRAEEMSAALTRGRVYRGESDFRRADGTVFRAHLTTTPIDPDDWQRGVVSVVRDVSELRNAQERAGRLLDALQSRVRKLRCVREVATILTDQEQPLETAVQRVVDAIPQALSSVDGAWATIVYDDVTTSAGDPAQPEGSVLERDIEGQVCSGTLRVGFEKGGWAEVPLLPEARTLVDSIGFLLQSHCRAREHQDQTERERDRFLTLFRSSPVATALSEPDTGVFLDVNRKWTEVTGFERDELIGRSSLELDLWIDPRHRDELRQRLAEHGVVDDFRVRFRRKDGAQRDAFGSVQLIEVDGETQLFSTLHDVTDQKILEERRSRMQERQVALERLAAIGELAGGVAHDINNLLLPILVNTELALPEVPDRVREQLEEVRVAAGRGRDLTRKLLSFSGKQTLQKHPVDLGELLVSSQSLFRRLVPENIELEVDVEEDLPLIHADPGQMELVLVNLVGNARDAIEGKGRIVLSVHTGEPPEDASTWGRADPDGPHVYLQVADDGCGIHPDVAPRIFEPFMSTKEDTSGSGLGLSSVLGIVERHGGHITVDTELGTGSTFRLGFPVHGPRHGESDSSAPVEPGEPVGEGRTVLVVEDDDAVRKVTARALRSFGYTVLAAESGSAALEVMESREDGIDLIISDMVMPGMSGLELRDVLRERGARIPILFVSGYSWATFKEHGADGDSVTVVEKPFTPHQLIEAVRTKLLEAAPPDDSPAGR